MVTIALFHEEKRCVCVGGGGIMYNCLVFSGPLNRLFLESEAILSARAS